MIDESEVRRIEDKVAATKRTASGKPWLYGYDVVGIQQFIGARSRPVAMRGASEAIREVDQQHNKVDGAIYGGGGRGIGLAKNQEGALACCKQLRDFHRSAGGVLATAAVPFHADSEDQCLRWLRARLVTAKDEAAPPPGILPVDKADQCTTCGLFKAESDIDRGDSVQRVCRICAETIKLGRDDPQMRQSLSELSPSKRIAAVSADGNGMGLFFDALATVEQYAVASAAIGHIFASADKSAGEKGRYARVPLITGGDDIRVFLAVEDLLPYVRELVEHVEAHVAKAAAVLRQHLPPRATEKLRSLGIGVGAVVSNDRHPASRLLAYAHWLEDSAKSICQTGSDANRTPVRSALDLEVLTDQDLLIAGLPQRDPQDGRPFSLDKASWVSRLRQAEELRSVSTSQIAALFESSSMELEEFRLHFHYQVARNDDWQRFFKKIGVDWKQPASLDSGYPGSGLLALYRVLTIPESRA